jgi:hypothetical protein
VVQEPPRPEDLLFKGVMKGDGQQITVTITPDREAITSVTIGSSLHAFYDPPLVSRSRKGHFETYFSAGYNEGFETFLELTVDSASEPDHMQGRATWTF